MKKNFSCYMSSNSHVDKQEKKFDWLGLLKICLYKFNER